MSPINRPFNLSRVLLFDASDLFAAVPTDSIRDENREKVGKLRSLLSLLDASKHQIGV